VGKKLVWQRGAVTKKQVVAPTPTPTPTPTRFQDAVSIEIDRLRDQAIRADLQDTSTHTFIFQGGASDEIEKRTKRSLLNALPIYKGFGFKITDGLFIVVRDTDWMKQELLRHECFTNRPMPSRAGFYHSGATCKNRNGAITSYHWEVEKFPDGLDGLYFNHVLPHEYFHQLQEQMTVDATRFGNGDFPKWFFEGSAQFFTNQAWSAWNQDRGYVEWFNHWWTDLRPDLGPSACKKATVSLMSDPATPGIEGVCAYSKGQLVVEFLVYKYGLEKYRLLYSRNMTPGWMNFHLVFEEVTGDKLEDFYDEAAVFISNRGW
jgi:hypothetical protein